MRSSRSLWIGVIACSLASCQADTSHLREVVNAESWIQTLRREQVADPDIFSASDLAPTDQANRKSATPTVARASLPIDLAAALKLAGSNAIEVQIARSEAEEAAFLAKAQQAQILPFLSPRLGYFHQYGQAQNTIGDILEIDRENATAGTGVDVVLQPSEAIYLTLAAQQRAEAASAEYQANVDLTLLRTATRYFSLAANHARRGIATDDARAAKELLRLEESREVAGAGLPATVARARARVAEAEGRLQTAIGIVASDTAELVGLLNLHPGTELRPKIADALVTIDLIDASQTLETLMQRAYQHNPRIKAAEHFIAAASAEQDMTRWGWLLPELRAGGTVGGFGPTITDLKESEQFYVGVQWRLDFGLPARHSANVKRHEQAELQLTSVRNGLAASIVRLQAQIKATVARVDAGRREVEAATEAIALVNSRYTEGVDLLLQVLDAQTALSRARTNLVTAVGDHNTSQYALLRVIGGPR